MATEIIRFPVSGMTCGSCVARITRALRGVPGIDAARVDLANEAATVRRDRDAAPDEVIAAAIVSAGYTPDLANAVAATQADLAGPLSRLLRLARAALAPRAAR